MVLAVIYAIVLGNMVAEFSQRAGTVSLWFAGASFAPLLPTLLTVHIRDMPASAAASMGLALGAGAFGNFLLQPMLERFSQRWSIAATMRLAMLLSLVFGALALMLALLLSVIRASH